MTQAAVRGVHSIAYMNTRTKVIVMAGTLLGMFTAAMDQTIVSTSMPRIIADLGGFGMFSWVGTAFLLTSTTAVPIGGRLTDIFGRKPFYMAGIATLMLGSALAGSSQNVGQLIAFRIIQGLGAGMLMGIAFAIVADVFPPLERGKWAGLMSGVFASASVLGPLIGGGLTDHVHWRWVFYVNLPLGTLALLVLFFGMPNIRPSTRSRLDIRGILILMAAVVPMLLAFSWAGSRYEWTSLQIVALLSWAAVALALFAYAEVRVEEPLFPVSLFRNRIFLVAITVSLFGGMALYGSTFYIPLFVQGVIGSSATNSGLVMMPMMLSMAISSAVTGQIISRLNRYRILGVGGLLVIMTGVFLLSRMDVHSTNGEATRAMIVLGIGLGMSLPLFMLAVQNTVPHRMMGIATSTQHFLRSVGGTMSIAILFSLIQRHYYNGLQTAVPEEVRSRPELLGFLRDPQFLLNKQAFQAFREAMLALGEQGPQLLEQTMQGVRVALASAIADAFLVAVFISAVAVVVGAFLQEVPLRTTHLLDEDEAVPEAPTQSPGAAISPLAGGADPLPEGGRGEAGLEQGRLN